MEGPVWKRVVRKNRKLARMFESNGLGHQLWDFFLTSLMCLFSSAEGQSQARVGRVVTCLPSGQHISLLLCSCAVQGSV